MGFGLASARSLARSVDVMTGGVSALRLRACEGSEEPERKKEARVVGVGSVDGKLMFGFNGDLDGSGVVNDVGDWKGDDSGVDACEPRCVPYASRVLDERLISTLNENLSTCITAYDQDLLCKRHAKLCHAPIQEGDPASRVDLTDRHRCTKSLPVNSKSRP